MMKSLNRLFNNNSKYPIAFGTSIALGLAIALKPSAAQLPYFQDSRSPAPNPQVTPVSPPSPAPPSPAPPSPAPPSPAPPSPTPPVNSTPIEVPPPSNPTPIEVPSPGTIDPPPPLPTVNDTTPPLPNQRQAPVAAIAPANGFVNVKLINRTAATINYEVIGDTTRRFLDGKSEVVMRDLILPATVSFYRDDGGFLLVQTRVDGEERILELTMTEARDFSLDRTSLTIEKNGSVFLN